VLILNRRQGEAILIDGGIRIIVLSSDRRGARIGIEAPTSVNIQREELLTRAAAVEQKVEDSDAPGSEKRNGPSNRGAVFIGVDPLAKRGTGTPSRKGPHHPCGDLVTAEDHHEQRFQHVFPSRDLGPIQTLHRY
jgi:carbon storage regulator